MAPLCWLVYGGNGWIGKQYVQVLKKTRPNDRVVLGTARVDDEGALANELLQVVPTHCVCMIGRTHGGKHKTIDYLEQKGKMHENVRDNLFAPMLLAEMCRNLGVHLTYLGTGCIFSYDVKHTVPPSYEHSTTPHAHPGYTEEDKPNFYGSNYSVVKGFTVRLMHTMFADSVLNVRIRMPISRVPHPRNFISKRVGYAKVHSMANSMTVLDDLLPVMVDMAVQCEVGTVNMTNPGVIDHDTILRMYRDKVDPSHRWTLVSQDTLQEQCVQAGRSNNFLQTLRLRHAYPDVPDIRTSVGRILDAWKDQVE